MCFDLNVCVVCVADFNVQRGYGSFCFFFVSEFEFANVVNGINTICNQINKSQGPAGEPQFSNNRSLQK